MHIWSAFQWAIYRLWVKYPLKFEDLLGRKPITCCNVYCCNVKMFWHSSRNYPDKTTVYFQGTIEKKAELRRSFLVDFKLVFPIADFCPLRGYFIISQVLLVSRRTIVMMCSLCHASRYDKSSIFLWNIKIKFLGLFKKNITYWK